MLNLDATITCGIWTPDDQQVYFGTTHGQIIVMDVHGAMVSQIQLYSGVGITAMAWSCEKFKMEEGEDTEPGVTNATKRSFVLAVSFRNGMIYMLKSYDDVSPTQINTELNGALGLVIEWSNSRELLAVAGTQQTTIPQFDHQGQLIHENVLKFYTEQGNLLYSTRIPNSTSPVSALTWGHNDKRIFIATGNHVHIAWLSRKVASLQLLCRLQIQTSLLSEGLLPKLPLPSRIKSLIGNLFAQTVRCYVPDSRSLREFVSRPPTSTRLHCSMLRHDDDTNLRGTCYTLYLEYLGGLVPLLKGKRTSKIRPEFVIFDPQMDPEAAAIIRIGSGSNGSASSRSTTTSGGGGAGTERSESSGGSDEDRPLRSPRTPRRKKTKGRKKPTSNLDRALDDAADEDLAYLDTLPESVKLVQVTSNIWGTKFKIHGLAKTVPSNLGQVSYKTSLLHLQPRQMTLVITELRDDFVAAPDPNYNPHVFSEDEEEQLRSPQPHHRKATELPTATPAAASGVPMIAPMSPRPTRFNNKFKTSFGTPSCTQTTNANHTLEANLARAESYEDDAVSDSNDELGKPSTSTAAQVVTKPGPSYATLMSQYSRSSSSSGQSRHAISPLCCEGSVPTLQSPKNAVAPIDIIFDRPPAGSQSNGASGLVSFHSGEYTSQSRAEKPHAKRKDLQFIDEESTLLVATPSTSSASQAPPPPPAIVPGDSMPRSCSVGYLDSVQLVPSESALSMLRREAPHKRLILVDKRPQKKQSAELKSVSRLQKNGKSKSLELFDLTKIEVPSRKAGPVQKTATSSATSSTPTAALKDLGEPSSSGTGKRPLSTGMFMSKTPLLHRKERPKACVSCKTISPTVNSSQALCAQCQAAQATIEVDASSREPSTSSLSPVPTRRYDLKSLLELARGPNKNVKRRTEVIKSYADSPLFNRKHRFQNQESKHERSLSMGRNSGGSGGKRPSSTESDNDELGVSEPPPSSGRSALTSTLDTLMGRGRFSSSAQNSPVAARKDKRHVTSSPIRQILNSPLLGGRRNRKNKQLIESSEDEQDEGHCEQVGPSTSANSKQYRDLETFQKAQLRQKVNIALCTYVLRMSIL